jgi:DNA-binding MarR family transcriptional regulator
LADLRPAFGFVLLAARDGPTTSTDLAALMGTTRQAASKLVDPLEGAGYIRRAVDDDDARQRPVHLAPRGVDLLAAVEAIYAELEQEWANVIGATKVARLRHDLTVVLTRTSGGQLPPVRPTW